MRKTLIKVHYLISNIGILAIAVAILASCTATKLALPEGKPKTQRTWKDLGFDSAPEGYPTDAIALIDGLNKGRGNWSFKGIASKDDVTSHIHGKMEISGSFKNGMVPMWNLALGWPAEGPEHAVVYVITVSPEATDVALMLVQIGPFKSAAGINLKPGAGVKAPRTLFEGTWDIESRTVFWKEKDLRAMFAGKGLPQEQQVAANEKPTPKVSFEMVVADNGEITIQRAKHTANRQQITGNAVARIGKPYIEEEVATNYDTYADVSDPRVKRCLPPGAVEITLHLERGGHFARYKVSETDFHNFLNDLWKTQGQSSAHQRDEMDGEGEPVNQELLPKQFERLGWKPLKKATRYYSPSKKSSAMTTYFYDREAGIVYHDTGYW